MAKEIADKLERDLREQKLRELRDSEKVAQQMQVSEKKNKRKRKFI